MRPLIICNYFAGWWPGEASKWGDWLGHFPERRPLLGLYNTPGTMDAEIAAAAEHGVDAFAILWYYNPPPPEPAREPQARLLNRGLENFLASPAAGKMKFYIEFCNHPPYDVTTDDQWAQCLAVWTKAMQHPSYLRVGGRAVFKVHGAHYFLKQHDDDPARARQRLQLLRRAARDAGAGELVIGSGVGAGGPLPKDHPLCDLFDFFCTYMDVPPLEPRENDYPFTELSDWIERGRMEHAQRSPRPYMPFVAAGWNPRPWKDPRCAFALPTREEWSRHLRRAADDLAAHPATLGLPLPDGSLQPAFTIYAWNEFGEGGFIAPTQAAGYMKLEALTDAFAGAATRTSNQ